MKGSNSAGTKYSNEVKLAFYAYYKQITVGPNKTKAPSRLNFVARAKWDAWSKLKKMSPAKAKREYIK